MRRLNAERSSMSRARRASCGAGRPQLSDRATLTACRRHPGGHSMTKRVAHCVETLDVADVTKRIELKHEAHLPCGRSIRIASPIAPSIPAKVETIKIASTVMRTSLRACALHQFANARMFRAPHDTFVSLCRAARGSAHPGAAPVRACWATSTGRRTCQVRVPG